MVPVVVGGGVLGILVIGAALILAAESHVNRVALVAAPKPVTVVEAKVGLFHPQRAYVGRIDPWVSASVGPQFVSAYVDTVLVRPGAQVKRGQVLATLDCRNASAMARAVDMQARALDAQQKALSDESSRVSSMLDGGFVSTNEAEQKSAMSSAKEAELLAEKAKLIGTSLEVNDCILRAPFDGDVATRTIDPGAFVRPGVSLVSVVDRSTVRMTADVPENDFDDVAPGRKARILLYATGKDISGTITRRAPAADPGTRTVHVEVDIADPRHDIPVGTTGELHVDVGNPVDAVEIPLSAATVTDNKSSAFVVTGDEAHAKTFHPLGESQGLLYVKPSDLPAGTRVVTQGRTLLRDGDKVSAKLEEQAVSDAAAAAPPAEAKP
ncbi:MAG TPA: efflux RND transporter periplasmic adaptor subunit [Polyangiaceae bacterium]